MCEELCYGHAWLIAVDGSEYDFLCFVPIFTEYLIEYRTSRKSPIDPFFVFMYFKYFSETAGTIAPRSSRESVLTIWPRFLNSMLYHFAPMLARVEIAEKKGTEHEQKRT